MNPRKRLLISAILGAVLMTVGFLGTAFLIPGSGSPTDLDFTNFYASTSKVMLVFWSVIVLAAAGWCLVWFFNELRSRLPDGTLSKTAYSIAIIGIAALVIGAGIESGPAGVQINSSTGSFVGVPVAHTFAQAGLGAMIEAGIFSLLVATVLFSIALKQSALVPSWVPIFGYICALLMISSFILVGAFFFPVWLIVLGIVGVKQRTETA